MEDDRLFSALQLYAEYAHRVDDGRIRDWSELFAADGVMVVRGQEHQGPGDIYAYLTKARIDGEPSQARHLITNVRVDVDNDMASLRADFTHVRRVEDRAVIEMIGRYDSKALWTDGGWRFTHHEVSFLLDAPGA